MRLCLINSARGWGGAERMFLEMAEGFLAAGHEVEFVCRPSTAMAARVPVGAQSHALAFRGDLDLLTLMRLHRLFRRSRPDAVLCNFGRECWLAGWAAAPLGLPLVQIKAVADQRHGGRSRFLYRYLVTRVVCISHAVRRGFDGLGVPAERFDLIYCGFDPRSPSPQERAAARARIGGAASDFVVAYSGRLVREKGVDLLPEVAAVLRAAGEPVRFVIIGEGELRPELERRFAALGLAESVYFTGFVEDPMPFVAAADAAVVPSRWTEAFGLVALEAMAAGTPLVAARRGGLAEIVVDEQSGLLVPAEDPQALGAALLRLRHDPGLTARLRAGGLARAAQFSRATMIADYEKMIRGLAHGGTSGDARPLPMGGRGG